LGETLRGAADVAAQAGALILGGHSIDDHEPKFGMVALGEVRPDKVITNAGARVGDVLVLTKPIGTGILSTALKNRWISEADMATAIRVMTTLNAGAARAMAEVEAGVHAATDVTGFGLLGHLHNVLAASGVGARIIAGSVPLFDGVPDLIAKGAVPGGTTRNLEAAARFASYDAGITDVERTWLNDAQTSGGLLIAVAGDQADRLLDALRDQDTPAAAAIGEITADAGRVEVRRSDG